MDINITGSLQAVRIVDQLIGGQAEYKNRAGSIIVCVGSATNYNRILVRQMTSNWSSFIGREKTACIMYDIQSSSESGMANVIQIGPMMVNEIEFPQII